MVRSADVPPQNLGERGTLAPEDPASAPSVADAWSGWEAVYLRYVQRFGARIKGAAVAGVSWRAVQAREAADQVFAEAVAIAIEEYLDGLEQKLVEQAERRGNPVGYIVRLKAGRPLQYIERSAIATVNVNVPAMEPVEARALLRRMLDSITDSTARMLTGEKPGALPPSPEQ